MNLGDIARTRLFTPVLAALVALSALPQAAVAQEAGSAPPPTVSSAVAPQADATSINVSDSATPAAEQAEGSTVTQAPGAEAAGYTPLGPEWIKGQPVDGGIDFQKQYSPDGKYAYWMHTWLLLPMMVGVSLLVLALLLYVIVRFNRRSNAVPSKTSHNTVVEVIWTVVPVLILVAIAIPSITLLARQYKAPAADALTVKVTGYQWYWGYSFPDNGGFEVISNMLDEGEARSRGEPPQLAADNRLVLPVGETIRMQVTGADVIHSFGIPSLWFKIDAVPGRLNERTLFIEEPGIFYGQCFELCGARHAYMPIVIEAVPRPQFEAWVRSQGGTVGAAEAGADAGAATPVTELPSQEPESSVEGAPGAGAAPTNETAPGVPAPAA
jgi:cytochrome c oxidase subunit 2